MNSLRLGPTRWTLSVLLVLGLMGLPAAVAGAPDPDLEGPIADPEGGLALEIPFLTDFWTEPDPASFPAEPSPQVQSAPPIQPAPEIQPASPAQPTPSPLVIGERQRPSSGLNAGAPAVYIPVLLYHYIRVNPDPRDRVGFGLSTTPARFHSQMQYLANHGFNVVTLHEAVAAIQVGRPLPPRSVVLTFDDGYADFFEAAVPEMHKHGFTGTVFVITGRIGRGGFLNWAQIRASDTMGFTVGAHTVDHVALASLPPARAFWQMQHSKLTLESGLGHRVLDFAYPYGSFNTYAQSAASKIGFETAVSTLIGSWHAPQSLMYLSRQRVGGSMPLARFAQLVGGPAPTPADLAE